MKITEFASPQRAIILKASNRDDALSELVSVSHNGHHDTAEFYQALVKREEILSTGIGLNVAYPHAKRLDIPQFFISFGISPDGIEWDSLDGSPAKLIFLIGGPEGQQEKYLKILSTLSKITRHEPYREKLIASSSKQELFDNFNCILNEFN